MNNLITRIIKKFDSTIRLFSNNLVWLHLLILWAIALIFANESDNRDWLTFMPVFLLFCIAFSPILAFSFFRKPLKERLRKWFFYDLTALTFIIYPLLLINTSLYTKFNKFGVFDFHETIENNDDVLYYIFLYIGLVFFILEIILNIRANWTYEFKFIRRIKKLTLEQALLIFLGFFAAFLSIIELASNGQGFYYFSDFIVFTGKWFFISLQFFVILFTYYLFYWVNHYVLINKVLKQKGIVAYVLSFMLIALIGYPIAAQIAWFVTSFDFFGMPPIIDEGPFDGIFFIFPFIEMLVSIPFILAIQWFKQGSEIANLEKEKSDAELNLLKQQINPHFFFNTLNNLYALSLKKDEATPDVILQLSELMRYVIYKGKEETVRLKEEVKYIEDYCELQQIRLYKDFDFRFTQDIQDENLSIPPLLFIILVENAFKHGIEPAEHNCFLHIHLESDEKGLLFTCKNSYEPQTETEKGIGLENLKQRLALRFPNQHQLKIIQEDSIYQVELRIY